MFIQHLYARCCRQWWCESVTAFGDVPCLLLTVSVVFQQPFNGLPSATLGRLWSKCYEKGDCSTWWEVTCPPFLPGPDSNKPDTIVIKYHKNSYLIFSLWSTNKFPDSRLSFHYDLNDCAAVIKLLVAPMWLMCISWWIRMVMLISRCWR